MCWICVLIMENGVVDAIDYPPYRGEIGLIYFS